jgi:YVTN family beta-propeller protein
MKSSLKDVTTRVYVPNSNSNTVDVIDPATYQVTDHFSVGKLPQHVTPSWDMTHLYVDNDISNTLTEIDPVTGKKGDTFPVDDPYNLYFTPDGSRAIVVAERNRHLDFYDPHTWKLVGQVTILHSGPNHLDFTADGRYLLVSCEFSGYVVKVDVQNMKGVTALNIGGKPTDVRISPDGKLFYVANETRNGVSVVDPESMKEIKFIPTAPGTHGFVVSRDAKSLYVTNRNAGTVSVLDFATQRITATWYTGGSPDMGGVTADGRELWVSGRYNAVVYVIDTFSGRVKHRIPVGSGPHGVCIFPQPGRFSLGHTGNYR